MQLLLQMVVATAVAASSAGGAAVSWRLATTAAAATAVVVRLLVLVTISSTCLPLGHYHMVAAVPDSGSEIACAHGDTAPLPIKAIRIF